MQPARKEREREQREVFAFLTLGFVLGGVREFGSYDLR